MPQRAVKNLATRHPCNNEVPKQPCASQPLSNELRCFVDQSWRHKIGTQTNGTIRRSQIIRHTGTHIENTEAVNLRIHVKHLVNRSVDSRHIGHNSPSAVSTVDLSRATSADDKHGANTMVSHRSEFPGWKFSNLHLRWAMQS